MKNFKKILIAVMVLAVLVTTVVITALAATEESPYTGDVATANAMLAEASSAATALEKSEKLIELNAYFASVDPDSEGFDALVVNYNSVTLSVGQQLLDEAHAAESGNNYALRMKANKDLYKHIEKACINEEFADATVTSRWEVLKENYTIKTYNLTCIILEAVKEEKDPDALVFYYKYTVEAPIIIENYEGYDELAKGYNEVLVEVLTKVLEDAPETTEALAEVLEFHDAAPLNLDYTTEKVEKAYAAFKTDYDDKLLKLAEDSLEAIVLTDPLADITQKIKDAYALKKSAKFFSETNSTSFEKGLTAKSYAIAKLYYKDVEGVIGTAESTDVPAFKLAASELLNFLKDCPSIIYRATPVGTEFGSLKDANTLYDAVKAENADVFAEYAKLYAFMHQTPVDPKAEGAADFYAKYDALTAEVLTSVLQKLNALDSAPTVEGGNELDKAKLTANLNELKSVAKLLLTTPLSLEAVNTYNNSLHGFTRTLKNVFDEEFKAFEKVKTALDAYLAACPIDAALLKEEDKYADFETSVKALANYEVIKPVTDYIYSPSSDKGIDVYRASTVLALNAVLSAELLDYDTLLAGVETGTAPGSLAHVQELLLKFNDAKGTAGEGATPEETQESINQEKISIYKEIYHYLAKNPINPKLDGYALFYNEFREAEKEMFAYITSGVDTIEKLGELENFLVKTPMSKEAVAEYNAAYLRVYRQALSQAFASYQDTTSKLNSFITSSGCEDAVANTEGFVEAIDNYEILELTILIEMYNLIYLDEGDAGSMSILDRGQYVKLIKAFINSHTISDSAIGSAEIKASADKVLGDYDAMVLAAKDYLDKQTPFEEYVSTGYKYEANFDDGKSPITFQWAAGDTRAEIVPEWDGDGYFNKYTYAGDKQGAYLYLPNIKSTAGAVIEFDISTDASVNGFVFSRIEYPTRQRNNFFKIDGNKLYPCRRGSYDATAWGGKEIITPGEWTKIILVFHPEEQEVSMWVDYEFVDRWSVYTSDYTAFTEVRISALDGVFYLDNYKMYAGTNFRIQDRFDGMDDADRFRYYVDYMTDENLSPTRRLAGYQRATNLLPQFENDPDMADYVAKYKALDVNADIINPAKEINLGILKDYEAQLAPYFDLTSVTSENSGKVLEIINKVDTFVANNSAYLDQASSEFTSIISNVNSLKLQISRCEYLLSFAKTLEQFGNAFTVAAKTRHYALATTIYDAAEFRDPDVRASLALDPILIAFEAKLNGDLSPADPNYITIFEYYELGSAIMDELQLSENSVKIIDCVKFIISMEGYEDSEEFWEANYDYIARYMSIIRSYVRASAYDPAYEGVNEAIARFEKIDVYFSEILKDLHVSELNEMLDRYANASTYIEKLGVCTSVTNYIANNGVDVNAAEVKKIIATNEAYLAELKIYEKEYAETLNQNTKNFINAVSELDAYVGYNDLKEVYEKALIYYYEMNSDAEETAAAIEKFEQYGEKLAAIEEASELFVGYAGRLERAKTDADIYRALVNCAPYIDKVSEDIKGVTSGLNTYETKLAEYNAKYEPCNNEISEINTVVCSVRTNALAQAVLAVIGAIFNK